MDKIRQAKDFFTCLYLKKGLNLQEGFFFQPAMYLAYLYRCQDKGQEALCTMPELYELCTIFFDVIYDYEKAKIQTSGTT